jgi:3-oxoacyl-[acyl-carrier-protein] synthase-3
VAESWLRGAVGARHALVVAAETFSRFLNPRDRRTAVLFGDGAAATVLGQVADGYGFAAVTLGSDGLGADDVLIPGGASRHPATSQTLDLGMHYIQMDGKAVRQFILDTLPRICRAALDRAGLTPCDIDLVVAHQPNPILIQEACAAAGLDLGKVVITGDVTGNIGAASTPYTLAHAHAQGMLRTGDRVLIVALGAGLTWGCGVLTWGGGPVREVVPTFDGAAVGSAAQ